MTKTLWILAIDRGVALGLSVELHAIYAVDRTDAERQAKEKEHPGKQISLQEHSNGFTVYRLVLPGKIEVSKVGVP